MSYQTLLVNDIPHGLCATLNRPQHKNSLNSVLVDELHHLLDQAENDANCRCIVIKGQQGIFCTGMDFQEMSQHAPQATETAHHIAANLLNLFKRFTLSPKVVITVVDGQVMAGGIGLVAASDIVIATEKSNFTLTEALWGLLPAIIMPFLIRRIGFQKAYLMTLTTQTINANQACSFHLIDEISDQPEEALRKHLLRIIRLQENTINELKQYFRKMWLLNEAMEQTAISELTRLLKEPKVQKNIKDYVEYGKFPWDQNKGSV